MRFLDVDLMIWMVGGIMQAVLLAVLVVKRRWRVYPYFTIFVGYQNVATLLLVLVYRIGSATIYHHAFWLSEALCFLLEVAVGVEMFVGVWRGADRSLRVPWATLLRGGLYSLVLASASAFAVGDSTMSILDLLAMRGAIFTSMLLCACFVVVSLQANALRLRRSRHAMVIGWGLTSIGLFELSEDISFFAAGWHRGINIFDRTEGALYILVVLFWIVGMWRNDELSWPYVRSLGVERAVPG